MAECLCIKTATWPGIPFEKKAGRDGECNFYFYLHIFSLLSKLFRSTNSSDYRLSQNLITRQHESTTDMI